MWSWTSSAWAVRTQPLRLRRTSAAASAAAIRVADQAAGWSAAHEPPARIPATRPAVHQRAREPDHGQRQQALNDEQRDPSDGPSPRGVPHEPQGAGEVRQLESGPAELRSYAGQSTIIVLSRRAWVVGGDRRDGGFPQDAGRKRQSLRVQRYARLISDNVVSLSTYFSSTDREILLPGVRRRLAFRPKCHRFCTAKRGLRRPSRGR
jgi:hypothetical protein